VSEKCSGGQVARRTLAHHNFIAEISFMRNSLRAFLFALTVVTCVFVVAQQTKKAGVLEPSELKTVVPTNYFFDDLVATVQTRNSGAARFDNGKLFVAAFVDNSGYSSDVAAKYQGLLITETETLIGDKQLGPGEYGFGFTKDGNFVVLNVAGDEVFHIAFQQDESLKRPVPLKIVANESAFRLYAGKKYVTFKTK
jgi:hypothetical protein